MHSISSSIWPVLQDFEWQKAHYFPDLMLMLCPHSRSDRWLTMGCTAQQAKTETRCIHGMHTQPCSPRHCKLHMHSPVPAQPCCSLQRDMDLRGRRHEPLEQRRAVLLADACQECRRQLCQACANNSVGRNILCRHTNSQTKSGLCGACYRGCSRWHLYSSSVGHFRATEQ